MSNDSEKKEYIHWQDLAQQLGADTSEDLYDYFSGTAEFEDDLGEVELENVQDIKEAEGVSDNNADDAPPDNAIADNDNTDNDNTDDDTFPIQDRVLDAGKSSGDHENFAVDDQSSTVDEISEPNVVFTQTKNELGIDWATTKPKTPSVQKRKPPAKKPKTPRDRGTKKADESRPPEEAGHWDELASSLGIQLPVGDSTSTESPLSDQEETQDLETQDLETQDLETQDLETQENLESKTGNQDEMVSITNEDQADWTDSYSDADDAEIGVFGDEPEAEDQVIQKAILEQMFVPPDEPFQEDSSETVSELDEPVDVDDIDNDMATEDSFSAEREYIEFEIEELDPTGEGESHRLGVDDAPEDTERPRSKRRRPAQSRGRRRKSSESEFQEQSIDDSTRDRPRSSERVSSTRSRSRGAATDSKRGGKDKEPRKMKKLPTWEETVNIIVDLNLTTRKKASRRRGRGKGRGNK